MMRTEPVHIAAVHASSTLPWNVQASRSAPSAALFTTDQRRCSVVNIPGMGFSQDATPVRCNCNE